MAIGFREGWKKWADKNAPFRSGNTTRALGTLLSTVYTFVDSGTVTWELDDGPFGASSYAMKASVGASTSHAASLRRSLGGNKTQVVCGLYFKTNALPTAVSNGWIIGFQDGSTDQVGVRLRTDGKLAISNTTELAVSTSAISTNVWYYIEFSANITSAGTGSATINVNGVQWATASSVDTATGTANNYATNCLIGGTYSATRTVYFGELYVDVDTTTMRGEQRVKTLFVNADDTAAFAATRGFMGDIYEVAPSANSGANALVLRKYTAPCDGVITDLGIYPNTTSAVIKVRGAIYADSAGAPTGAPLVTGTEVVGMTAGSRLTLPLPSTVSITKGTTYWIGYQSDTLFAAYYSDFNSSGLAKAATYASGLPNPVGTGFSSTNSWCIWALITPTSERGSQVNQTPPYGDFCYNSSANVGDEDVFALEDLDVTPSSVGDVTVYGYLKKTDSGARTVDLGVKSGTTTSDGDASGFAVGTSFAYYKTQFPVDPNTGAAWSPSAINSLKVRYKNAS